MQSLVTNQAFFKKKKTKLFLHVIEGQEKSWHLPKLIKVREDVKEKRFRKKSSQKSRCRGGEKKKQDVGEVAINLSQYFIEKATVHEGKEVRALAGSFRVHFIQGK